MLYRSLATLSLLLLTLASAGGAQELSLESQGAVLSSTGPRLMLTVGKLPSGIETAPIEILAGDQVVFRQSFEAGEHEVYLEDVRLGAGEHQLTVRSTLEANAPPKTASASFSTLPSWLSIAPPLVAILMALIFREVLLSLFAGIFLGALMLEGWVPWSAFARTIDSFITPAAADTDNMKILLFSALLGGMVGVISKSGGTRGIVERLSPLATSPRRGQVATWLMGLVVFFDDYANTLIVGSTMRPITDRLRISREKLAYIVDSTAAPIASIVPISTWIGFELGLIAAAFDDLELGYDPYVTFLASIPYRFYPLLALVLGLTVALSRRDFGPMLKAEQRAASSGEVHASDEPPLADYNSEVLEPPEGAPHRARNAIFPILTVVGVTLGGLISTGMTAIAGSPDAPASGSLTWWREVFANADSFNTLLWASLAGCIVGVALPITQRILSLKEATAGLVEGIKAMMVALMVLILAWSIGDICDALHTADFLVGITEGVVSPNLIPILTFGLAAAIAFSTGTSWATMSILVPLVLPILHGLALKDGLAPGDPEYTRLLLGVISSVLAGAVWGDHCSPISDTTILSSMGAGCNHVAHVRTQLPYALSVGVLGMLVGDLPTAYGLSPWISLLAGAAVIVAGMWFFGRRSRPDEPPGPAAGEPASG
ncbi:MAG: Na+/H+ antiporter NhaC family protein [Acidobacteriota bacterium]